jgi:hypothetical protein
MTFPVPKGSPLSTLLRAILSIFLLFSATPVHAQLNVPINVQGRVTVDGLAFNGIGKFKFALLLSNGRVLLWANDGSAGGSNFEPAGSVDLNVVKGLYSVMLGDTTIPGMTAPINPDIFTNPDVRLRIWFNDNTHGFQQLLPDQRVGAVGYSYNSERAAKAAVLTGNVTIQQVPQTLVTNNATDVNLTGAFTGDGSGLIGIRGSTPFQIANTETNVAFPNTGYLVTNPVQRVVLLPATAAMRVGDIVRVSGSGSWKIAQNAAQSIVATHFHGGVGAAWVPRDAARNWTGIATSTNGMNLVAFDQGKLIYLSTNGGVTWVPPQVSPQRNWTTAASSADGERLIVGTSGDYLFISTDSGQSWGQRVAPGQRVWTGVASSSNGSNLVAVASGASPLFMSADGGASWTQPQNAGVQNWTSVACSADGISIVAATTAFTAISRDRGTNWTSVLNQVVIALACSSDFQRIVAAVNNGNIYTSSDAGVTWIKRDASGAKAWRDLTCSADGSIIAATAPDGISISVDGGGAWTVRAGAKNWQAIACSSDGTKFAATVFGGNIFTSEAATLRTTALGVTGYLAGGEYSAVELQHTGNGQFLPLSSSGQIYAY